MRPSDSDEQRRKAGVFFILWLISFAGLAMLYVQYRTDGIVEVFGSRWEGGQALTVLLIVAIIPVTLLAKAAQYFFKSQQTTN